MRAIAKTGKFMLKKINTNSVLIKKIRKKTQKFPNVSEILFYTLTKDLNLTPEQLNDYHNNFPICLARNN